MAGSPLGMLLRHLTGGAEGAALTECSDGQLLDRFLAHREESAFAGLLRRHGPMVLSVCRRALANEQDREDVFQATFLLLARKAGSIRRRESVGSWLHGVAHRLAVRCRLQEDRRRVHERQAGRERAPSAQTSEAWEELRTLLDEAIAELPEKYRSALVLCYLEDHTHEEAARRLGCRLTTLRSRVARGRERLRTALLRRGLALSSAAFLTALATSAAQAALPLSLRIHTLIAALQFAKGDAVSAIVSPSTAALVEGGLRAMSTVKLKALFVVLLISGLTLGGAGLLARQILGAKNLAESPQPSAEPAAVTPPENKAQPAVDRFGDPLPQRAVARLGTIRFRLGGLFYACAFSPDGKILAAATGEDHNIYLFDPDNGKLIRKLPFLSGHVAEMTCIAYSPDGRTLASGGADGVILLREADTGKKLRQLQAPKGSIFSLIFSRNGVDLFSAGGDSPIRAWDAATGKEKRQFSGPKEGADRLVLSPDGRAIASNGRGNVQLWDAATGKLIRPLTTQMKADDAIKALAFSPDGKLLAAGSKDCTIRFLDPSTGELRRRLPEDGKQTNAPFSEVYSLAFAPDGKTLAAGCADHTLSLWDVDTGRKLREHPGVKMVHYRGHHEGGIPCVVFSPDGRRLAFGQDNRLALLDAHSGEEVLPFEAHWGAVQKIFFGPSGERLVTISDDPSRRMLEWDAVSGRLIRPMRGNIIYASRATLSPDGKVLVSDWWGDTGVLHFWETTTGKVIRRVKLPPQLPLKPQNSPSETAFSPDGKFLAVASFDGKAVWLLGAATGKPVCTVEGMRSADNYRSLSFSADGRILASAAHKTIQVAEIPSGQQLPQVVLPQEGVTTAAALSPDGRTLAAWWHGTFPGSKISLWETATGKERRVIPGPRSHVAVVTFSPDGRLLAAGGWDQIVFVWDTTTGKQVARLEGHRGNVESLAFSPDGRRLASGGQDTTALIWDVSGLDKELPRRGPLSRKELDELWSTLAGADAAKAYQAILTLESVSDQALPLLAERLRLQADDKRISRLLALLDSDDFTQRERATKELRELGWAAEPALHKALEGKPSLEVRQRGMTLLDDIRKQPLPPEMLRMLRGMEVLEHIGTPAAREIIASLAEGTPPSRLTREAKAVLQRLR